MFSCQFSLSFITWLFFFSRNCNLLGLIGNKTLCRPLRSVIILVINKSDSRCALHDYRPDRIGLQSVSLPFHNVMYNSSRNLRFREVPNAVFHLVREASCHLLSLLFFRAGSSAVLQMSCSLGLGLFLSKLYEEHFRHVLPCYTSD